MKNFFKKLSFVMAAAMVISSLYAPAAKAAAKDSITLKGKAISKKSIFVGGEKVNFDYKIGKFNNKGADGKWSTSDTSVITVNKHGVVTAVGTGDATLMLKVKKNTKKGIKKNLTFKVKLTAFARASKLEIPASDKAISLKVGEVKDIIPLLTNKVDGVDTTYKVFAKSSDESVATVIAEGKKVTVEAKMASATPATITVFAAQKSNEDDAFNNKYKVEDSFTVKVVANLEAKQSGAKTIKVSGADLSTDSAMYVLKNANNVPVNVKSVTVNEAKTEAVIEAYALPAGKYTVTYNKDTELMVDVVKAIVTSIEISPEDKFIITDGATAQNAYVSYKVFDQFGNDVTKESFVKINANGAFLKAGTPVEPANKKVLFQVSGSEKFVPNLSRTTLTLVDENTGVNKTAMLVASVGSALWEVSFKGIYDTKNNKFVESIPENAKIHTDNVTLEEYLLLSEGKDQYGNAYEADSDKLNVVLSSATNLKAGVAATKKVGDVTYLSRTLAKIAENVDVTAGKVDVIGINVNNGNKFSGNFEVVPTQKVDNIEVYAPAEGLFNQKESVLSFTATDVDGNVVTDLKILEALEVTKTTGDNGTIKFEEGKDKKVVLKYKPGFTSANKSVLTFKTKTNKFKTFFLDVKAERVPSGIATIKSDAITGVTRGGTLTFDYKKILFLDQDKQLMTYDDVVNYNTNNAGTAAKIVGLKLTHDDGANFGAAANNTAAQVTANLANPTIASKSTADSTKTTESEVKVQLLKNTQGTVDFATSPENVGDVLTVKIFNVRLDDVSNIKFEKQDIYAPSDAAPNAPNFDVKLTGTFNSKNITLNDGDYYVVNGVTTKTAARNDKKAAGDAAFSTKKVEVILNNTAKTLMSEDYKFGKEDRRVVKLELKKTDEISEDDFEGEKTFAQLISNNFKLVDQYGEEISSLAANVTSYMFIDAKDDLTLGGTNATDRTIAVADGATVIQKIKIMIGSLVVFDGEVSFKNPS